MKELNVLIIGCIGFCLLGCTHFLYPAERQPFYLASSLRPIPEEIFIPVGDNSEVFVHAWYFPAQPQQKNRGVVVHFHGNGQNLTTHFMFLKWIIDAGYDYLIFDYRGYGQSSDERASQSKTVEDAESVLRYVHDRFKGANVIAVGQSLGSNVLVRTLQEFNQRKETQYLPKLVVLESSFLSYQQAARSILRQRWFLYPLLPVSWGISDKWSAKNKLSETPKIPALFFHGTADPMIRMELGRANFEAWPGAKIFLPQEGGGHTSAFLDRRFLVESRKVLLKCIEQAVDGKTPFEDCAK